MQVKFDRLKHVYHSNASLRPQPFELRTAHLRRQGGAERLETGTAATDFKRTLCAAQRP